MTESNDRTTMQGPAVSDTEEWAMPERRERAVMRDVPEKGTGRHMPGGHDGEDFRLPTSRGVLTKEEIEALLRPNLPKINEEEEPKMDAGEPFVASFDDRLPGGMDARRLAARITLLFAQATGLKAAFSHVASERFDTFGQRPSGTQAEAAICYVCFGDSEDVVTHILEVPAMLGNALISHVCGGSPGFSETPASRELSAIDCALIEQLLSPLRNAFGAGTRFLGVETDAGYVGSLIPGAAGQALSLDVRLDRETTRMCLSVLDTADTGQAQPESQRPHKRPVSVLLTARMASLSVPVSRLSGLKPGDTLLLGLPSDQPVELLSGGRDGVPAFEGDIGRKGGNMAVRIRKTFNS